jgi:hypothetical protein
MLLAVDQSYLFEVGYTGNVEPGMRNRCDETCVTISKLPNQNVGVFRAISIFAKEVFTCDTNISPTFFETHRNLVGTKENNLDLWYATESPLILTTIASQLDRDTTGG